MRLLAIIVLLSASSLGQSLFRIQKFCELGGQNVTTQGLTSATKVQQSFPGCTVTVYLTATITKASIFSDSFGTPLSNPFTGNTDGSFGFYVASSCYDVVTSGGAPNQLPSPFTYSYICPGATGAGGSVTSFSSGNLSPLFTTSVATPSSTPTQSFSLSNAAPNTVYGNLTGGSAPPSFSQTQGTDAKVMTAGTVSGVAATLCTDANGGATTTSCSNGGGGANKVSFDQCTPAQTTNAGNSFWTVQQFSNWDAGHWEFVLNTAADVYCSVRIPSNASGTQQIILDLTSSDVTAGHTATFNTADKCTVSLNPQVGSLTSAATQTYTSTTTAYANTELTFNAQSSCAVDQILVVQIHQASGGTNTANILMQPPKVKVF